MSIAYYILLSMFLVCVVLLIFIRNNKLYILTLLVTTGIFFVSFIYCATNIWKTTIVDVDIENVNIVKSSSIVYVEITDTIDYKIHTYQFESYKEYTEINDSTQFYNINKYNHLGQLKWFELKYKNNEKNIK